MNLINGDCLVELTKLDDNSIDLVILDLPYGQTDCHWDNKINLEELWKQLKRVGKTNTAYIFFTTTKFGYELIKSNEKWFRYDLVWSKPDCCAGFLNAKKMPMRSHEMIYIFYNKLPTYNIEDNHIRTKNYSNAELTSSVYKTKIVRVTGKQWEPKLPSSLLVYPNPKFKKNQLHSTQKPIELLEWLIKYYSKTGDTILDPTMGSGSTGVACKNLNRNFIGIEIDTEIFDIAKNRIDNL